jgi:hypothetical protein
MSEAKSPTPSPESSRGFGGGLIRWGQIAGAITALITVGLLIWTQVKPAAPAPPPAALKATVSPIKILAPRSWQVYLDNPPGSGALEQKRAEFRKSGLHEEEIDQLLQKPGFIFEFTVEVKGPAGREYSLYTQLYQLPAEVAIPESQLTGSFPGKHFTTHAGVQGYESEENGWIEYPAHPGKYLLEVELIDKEGHPVAKERADVTVPRS